MLADEGHLSATPRFPLIAMSFPPFMAFSAKQGIPQRRLPKRESMTSQTRCAIHFFYRFRDTTKKRHYPMIVENPEATLEADGHGFAQEF
jgi:hypothetical protein